MRCPLASLAQWSRQPIVPLSNPAPVAPPFTPRRSCRPRLDDFLGGPRVSPRNCLYAHMLCFVFALFMAGASPALLRACKQPEELLEPVRQFALVSAFAWPGGCCGGQAAADPIASRTPSPAPWHLERLQLSKGFSSGGQPAEATTMYSNTIELLLCAILASEHMCRHRFKFPPGGSAGPLSLVKPAVAELAEHLTAQG